MRGKLMFGAASAALLALAYAAPASAQADPAGDATTQAVVSVGQPVTGAIEPVGDIDWYRLEVSQGQRYTISLNAADGEGQEASLDPMLFLYDAQGEELAFNDDADASLNSRLSYVPTRSGHVFVAARAFADSSAGAYTLSVEAAPVPRDEAGNDATTRARINPGRPVTGALDYEGDTDWYRLNVRTGQSYRITLTSADGEGALSDPLLRVVDADNNELAFNDDDDGLNAGLDFVPQRNGAVFIIAGAFSESDTGAYRLSVEATRLPADPTSADTRTRGRLSFDAPTQSVIDYQGDRDWHRIRLEAGQTYRFSLIASGDDPLSDPYMRLYNSRGEELAADDDGGGELNSLIEFTAPTTGNYFVEAAAFADSSTGGYTLSARRGDIPGDNTTDVSLSADGDYREGVLSPAGDRDWYRLELTEGQAVRISLTNPIATDYYDPLAVLYGPDGEEVARDDDGGEGLNSWLEYQAVASGVHFFEVRGFNDDAEGQYVIQVSAGEIPDNPDTSELLAANGDGRTSIIGAPGDSDWFAIDLVEARPYRFKLEGMGENPLGDPVLTLYNAAGEEVASDDDGGPGLSSYLSYTSVTGGPHFVGVSGFGDSTGVYYVSAVDTEVPGHIFTDEMLDAEAGDERASRIDIPGDLDYFHVGLERGQRYTMRIVGTGTHPLRTPRLALVDSENNVIARAGRNNTLRFTAPESGAYFIQASGVGGATGTYQVSIMRQ